MTDERGDFYFEVSNGEESDEGHIWATEAEMRDIAAAMAEVLPYMTFTYMETHPEVDYVLRDDITPTMVAQDILLDLGYLNSEDIVPGPYIHYHPGSHIAHPGIRCRGCTP